MRRDLLLEIPPGIVALATLAAAVAALLVAASGRIDRASWPADPARHVSPPVRLDVRQAAESPPVRDRARTSSGSRIVPRQPSSSAGR